MAVTSQFLNSIRDCFLLPTEVKKQKENIAHLETAQKAFRVTSFALACFAIYFGSFSLLIPAYLCVESSAIASNVQEIFEDVVTTLSVVRNKANCQNQLFKNAPLFRQINWIVGPYVKLEEQAQKLVKEHVIIARKKRFGL